MLTQNKPLSIMNKKFSFRAMVSHFKVLRSVGLVTDLLSFLLRPVEIIFEARDVGF